MATNIHSQNDLVKAITDIAAAIPPARALQLYEFAVFLKSHPLPTEETFEEIAADEALWDAQFAAADDDKLLGDCLLWILKTWMIACVNGWDYRTNAGSLYTPLRPLMQTLASGRSVYG